MKRMTALCMALLFLALLIPSVSSAFGTADGTMAITHINQRNSYEGAGIIIDGAKYEKIGDLGNYAWWNVLIFDWDADQGCYVLVEKNINSNNVDKSSMEIPRTGFAYGACVGNDYSSSGGINYKQTTRMIDSIELARSLNVGAKAYLYGVNLAEGQIKNNGKQWYASDYVTESYIKIGTPEEGKTAYEPGGESQLMQYVIEPNFVNSNHYASGDCILFDNENTMPNGNEVKYNYSWWTCLVFSWDAEQQCFVCVANDKTQMNGMEKTPPIPEGGFVILDCYSTYAGAISACLVGTKAWLYSNGGSYRVYLNEKPSAGTEVKRTSGSLAQPVFNGTDGSGALQMTDRQTELSWAAVSGATEYLLSVSTSSIHTLGEPVLHPTRVSGTSYTLPAGSLEAGQKYTVFLQALASGKASVTTVCKLSCVYESALTSSLRGKTVVAFGDSLTARTGWVDMLSGIIGTEVINSGVGGDSTNNGKARFQKDVLDKNADVVLICFGMNDQAQVISSNRPNISLATYTANMEYFVEKLQEQGADVVFICPHDAYKADGYYSPGTYGLDYAYGNMADFCAAVRQIAIKYGTDFVDIYTEAKSEDMSKFLSPGDGIHQSSYGHQKWAEYIGSYLLAKYDGENSADVSVLCKDSSGNELKNYSFTAAIGASLQIPAASFDKMTLQGSEQTVEAGKTATVTYQYRSASDLKLGDINGDGVVNAIDYNILKRYILRTTNPPAEQIQRMDINGDGRIVAQDYTVLKRIVLKTYSPKA